jgi:hypothetical protein
MHRSSNHEIGRDTSREKDRRHLEADRKRSRSKDPAVDEEDQSKRLKVEENGFQAPMEVRRVPSS